MRLFVAGTAGTSDVRRVRSRAAMQLWWLAVAVAARPRAGAVRDDVARTQLQGLTAEGVRSMQGIEASLLATALELEIIDAIDQRAAGTDP
ncbi:MAG TPA: hypothetical protein VEF72_03155 [Mycobacterium sp.]|nr:hypothetical protein [Mycobacterium sp.]